MYFTGFMSCAYHRYGHRFLLLQNFIVATFVGPRVCFILVLILIPILSPHDCFILFFTFDSDFETEQLSGHSRT